jgi:crotonobetaine/carnitine-CoA ligase
VTLPVIIRSATPMSDDLDLGGGTISGLLSSRAARTPAKPALICEDVQLTYAELDAQATAVGAGLLALGLGLGESVGVFLSNRAEYLCAYFGITRAGLVEVPINTAYKGTFLDYALAHTDVRVLITESKLVDALGTLPELPEALSTVVFVDEVPAGFARPGVRALTWAQLLAEADPQAVLPAVDPSDTAVIMLTSGTTGKSKGVVCPHLHNVVGAQECATQMGTTADDRLYTCLPLFHGAAAINIALHAIYAGATIVLGKRFSASRFWDELRRHGVTQFNALGSMLPVLLAQPPSERDRDHPAVRAFAAPAPPEVLHPFEERFGVHIIEGYGLTEIKNVTYNPLEGRKIGSFGKPTASTILDIHDDHGHPLGPREVGEIVYRPRLEGIIFKHYHRDPDATLASFRDGWWRTGDLGYQDEDGFFYFVDRKKDALRRRGENISSQEVESVLRAFPGVIEAAAVATPSELGEDEVLAVVQVGPNQDLDFQALFAHCDRTMPHFMVPRYYRVVDQMPRTPTGKLQKGVLRQEGLSDHVWDSQAAGLTPTRNL